MTTQADVSALVELPVEGQLWNRFFLVAPLVLVGTREPDGSHDLAPKHMAMPLGWQRHYCFVCSPRHATYTNIRRTGEFTVTYPRPGQIVQSALSAGGRVEDGSKPNLAGLPTFPARTVDGVLVEGGSLFLECRLERLLDGFGENSLVIGRVVAAFAPEEVLRGDEVDDHDLLHRNPVLTYLAPGRYAAVAASSSFPFPVDFRL